MILTKVSYPKSLVRNYPTIYANAYNVRDVLLKTGCVFLSEEVVSAMKRHTHSTSFTQRLDEESMLRGVIPKEEILYDNMLLQLQYFPTLRKYYLVDVLFRNRSLRQVVNMESAHIFLDTEIR